jgi:hypothetical protein
LTVSLVGIFRRMARKLRIEYPGAIYHVMNRGGTAGRIFSMTIRIVSCS